ncbi:hypothetical protein BDM02DRAFT_3122056, partial [Thelephora ganbajun]
MDRGEKESFGILADWSAAQTGAMLPTFTQASEDLVQPQSQWSGVQGDRKTARIDVNIVLLLRATLVSRLEGFCTVLWI